MKKYEIMEERFEFRQGRAGEAWTVEDIEKEYFRGDFGNGRYIGEYESKEEAYAEFAKCEAETSESQGYIHKLLTGTAYLLWENEYDNDGEFIQGAPIELKVEPFEGYDE